MHLKRLFSEIRKERGVEVIEFVGVMPLILMVAYVIWQFMLMAHVGMMTANAAREGARAASTYESAAVAVARTTGSFEYRVSAGTCAGEGSIVKVRVRIKIPMVDIPFVPLPQLWTDHTATARCEARF